MCACGRIGRAECPWRRCVCCWGLRDERAVCWDADTGEEIGDLSAMVQARDAEAQARQAAEAALAEAQARIRELEARVRRGGRRGPA